VNTHPWLTDVGQSAAEAMSDRDSAKSGAVELGLGDIRYVAPGSIPDQLGIRTELHVPMPKGRTEGSEADSNIRQYGSFGASNQPSATNKAGV
jgi:hypothetical protein